MRLNLFLPVPKFIVFQGFGANDACVISDYPKESTVTSKVNGICPAGFVELYPLLGMKGHTGIDCEAGLGVPLYACRGGIVRALSTEPERGLGVDVITEDKWELDDGNSYFIKWRYWHLKDISVQLGQRIYVGDLIGHADTTGLASGPHLHWEIKPAFPGTDGEWYNTFQNNGYFGSIDFSPYITQIYCRDAMVLNLPRNLSLGSTGDDVKSLQEFLNKHGYTIASSGPGSPGHETTYFGSLTKAAVKQFQCATGIVCSGPDLLTGWGSVGPKTRFKISQMSAEVGSDSAH